MKKTRSIAILTALTVLSACTAATQIDDDTDTGMIDDDETSSAFSSAPYLEDDESSSEDVVTISSVSSAATVSSTPAAVSSVAASKPTAVQTRTIAVHVTDWSFTPTTITAKKGEKVKLQITGDKGIHGFAVPGLSMNLRIEAGKTVTVDLPTDTAGTFEARCSIPCGPGHRDMKATVIISE